MVAKKSAANPGGESELDKLRKKAGGFFDVDAILRELTAEVLRVIPKPDIPAIAKEVADLVISDAVINKIAVRVEAQVGAKLSSVTEALKDKVGELKGQDVDVKAIIEGVVAILQPQIAEVARNTVEMTFKANQKALIAEMNKAIESKALAVRPPGGDEAGAGSVGNPAGGEMGMGSLLGVVLANAEPIAKLVAAIKGGGGPASPDAALANQIGMIFRWHKLLNNMESGKADADTIQKAITETATGTK